ncbi:hypothetical protein V8C43DRAFT_156122 [Trichoderma afarasin]
MEDIWMPGFILGSPFRDSFRIATLETGSLLFLLNAFYTAIFSLLASLIPSQFFFCFVHNNSTYLPRIGLWRQFTMTRNLGQGFFLHFYSAHCIYYFLSPLSITATRDTSYMIERFYPLPIRV